MTPGHVTNANYSTMECDVPALEPHRGQDCSNGALCRGVGVVVTNDGVNFSPQVFGPKWNSSLARVDLGQNPLKLLFSDLFVSVTGNDLTGDGTKARPYQTLQRAIDVAQSTDTIRLFSGVYKGRG